MEEGQHARKHVGRVEIVFLQKEDDRARIFNALHHEVLLEPEALLVARRRPDELHPAQWRQHAREPIAKRGRVAGCVQHDRHVRARRLHGAQATDRAMEPDSAEDWRRLWFAPRSFEAEKIGRDRPLQGAISGRPGHRMKQPHALLRVVGPRQRGGVAVRRDAGPLQWPFGRHLRVRGEPEAEAGGRRRRCVATRQESSSLPATWTDTGLLPHKTIRLWPRIPAERERSRPE
eukprot:1261133-Prymnesium_polylepis.1